MIGALRYRILSRIACFGLFLLLSCFTGWTQNQAGKQKPSSVDQKTSGGTSGTDEIKSSDLYGEITGIQGKTNVQRKFKKVAIKIGDSLQYNDVIRTGAGSSLSIQRGKGNNITVPENTRLKLVYDEKKKRSLIDLESGRIRCKLNNLQGKRFMIKTPVAVVGVRGTDFIVQYNPNAPKDKAFSLFVLEGKVEVGPPDLKIKRIELVEKQSIQFSSDSQPSAIETLSDDELNKVFDSIKVNDTSSDSEAEDDEASIEGSQNKQHEAYKGQYKLSIKNKTIVADGKQSIEILVAGISKDDQGKVKWNVESSTMSPANFILDDLALYIWKPKAYQGKDRKRILRFQMGDLTLEDELSLKAPVELMMNKTSLTLGKDKTCIVEVKNKQLKGLFLKSSQGKVEALIEGKKWKVEPIIDSKPVKVWLSLHARDNPSLSLAKASISIVADSKIGAEFEDGAKLFVLMDGKRYGPIENDQFKVLPGITEVTFIAIDAAGNERRVVKQVDLPPKLDLMMTSDLTSLPLGGMSTRVQVISLSDQKLNPQELKVQAQFGKCSALTALGMGRFAFNYTSPQKGKPGIDTISISKQRGQSNAKVELKLQLVEGVLANADMKPLQVQTTEEGQTQVFFELKLSDINGNPINNNDFKINAGTSAKVLDVISIGEGKFSFQVQYNEGVKPEDVNLDLNFGTDTFDPKNSRIQVYPSSSATKNDVLILVSSQDSKPLGGVEIAVQEDGQSAKIVKTNSLGIINYTPKSKNAALLQIGFKGFPATVSTSFLARPPDRKLVNQRLAFQELEESIFSGIQSRSQATNVPLSFSASALETAKNSATTIDRTPSRMIIKPSATKFTADGKTAFSLSVVILNKQGIPVPQHKLIVSEDFFKVSTLRDEGNGSYQLKLTPQNIEEDKTVKLNIGIEGSSVKNNVSLKAIAPSSIAVSAEPIVEADATATTTEEESTTVTSSGNTSSSTDSSSTSTEETTSSSGNTSTTSVETLTDTTTSSGNTTSETTTEETSTVTSSDNVAETVVEEPIASSIKWISSTKSAEFPTTIELKVEVLDQNGEKMNEADVSFSLSESKGSVAAAQVKTSNGVASTTYTPVDEDYNLNITAASGSQQASYEITITKQPVTKVATTVEVESAETEITFPNPVELKVKVLDQFSEALQEGTASISLAPGKGKLSSTSLTLSGGEGSFTYTPVDESYELVISVKSGDVTQSVTINVLEEVKPPTSIKIESAPSKTIKIGEELFILAGLKDKKGNPVKDGFEIDFKSDLGSFSPSSVVSAGGKAGSTFTPANTVGSAVLTISYDGVEATHKIEVLPGNADKNKFIIKAVPTSIVADGIDTSIIEVEVRDSFNNLITGERINFSVSSLNGFDGTLNKEFDNSDSSGLSSVIYKSGKGNDTITIKASVNSDPTVFTEVTLTQKRKTTRLSLETAADGTGTEITSFDVVAGETVTYYSVGRDINNNFVQAEPAVWSTDSTSGGISTSFLTSKNGGLEADFKSNIVGSGTFSFKKGAITSSSISITVVPAAAASFSLTANNTGTAGIDHTVFITALDAFGNTATDYQGLKNLTFDGAKQIGGFQPTAKGTGSDVQFGSATSVNFTAGTATATLDFKRSESVDLHITEGSLTSSPSQGVRIVVGNSKSVGKFDLFFIKISGRSGAHIVVTAIDIFGNIMVEFDPTEDMTFRMKSGTPDPANFTWSDLATGMTDLQNGTVQLSASSFATFNTQGQYLIGINNTKAESNTFEVNHGSVSATTSTFTWSPDQAAFLLFETDPPTSAQAGQALTTFKVKVIDQFNNLLTNDNGRTITLTVTSGTSVFTNASAQTVAGIATFSTSSYPTGDTVTFQATSSGINPTITKTITVLGGSTSKYQVSVPSTSVTAGVPFTVTLEARNDQDTTANTYTGTASFSSSDAQASLPSDTSFTAAGAGFLSASVTLKTAGTHTLTIVDSSNNSISGVISLTVAANPTASKLAFNSDLPKNAIKGSNLSSFTILVQDAYSNTTSSSIPVTLSLLTGAGTLGGTLTQNSSSGIATFNDINHDTQENITLRASATGLSSADSSSIEIANSGIHHFVIEAPFTSLTVGQASLVNNIKAVDANGDVVTDYTGTVQFTSSDPSATLPGNYTFTAFDLGTQSFTNGVTFNTAGSQYFSVEDTAIASTKTQSPTFTISTTSSKPSLSKASDSTAPTIEQLMIYPKKFNPSEGTKSEYIIINCKGMKDNLAIDRVIVNILDGTKVVKRFERSLSNDKASFIWRGRNDQDKIMENGVYVIEANVYDAANNKTVINGSVEIDSNFDFGSYGP